VKIQETAVLALNCNLIVISLTPRIVKLSSSTSPKSTQSDSNFATIFPAVHHINTDRQHSHALSAAKADFEIILTK